jgi:hypothetical protein
LTGRLAFSAAAGFDGGFEILAGDGGNMLQLEHLPFRFILIYDYSMKICKNLCGDVKIFLDLIFIKICIIIVVDIYITGEKQYEKTHLCIFISGNDQFTCAVRM